MAQQYLKKMHPQARVWGASWWEVVAPQLDAIKEAGPTGSGHAGEMETSLMLALRPDLVLTDRLHADGFWPESEYRDRVTRFMRIDEGSERGHVGDPTVASAEKGERMLSAIVDSLIEVVEAYRAISRIRTGRTAEVVMKVTEIEVHRITLPYMDWISYQLNHYYGPISRTIYVAHTDDGLVGLGESHNTEPQEAIDGYIGTNPFDHLGDEVSLGLGTAMYDLMGKAAGVPVYKLIGQKYRSWVPVGSWTVSTHPERMAEAVREYSARGYTWLKFHLSPFENVIDQTEAMQAVAPAGFKVHYDFTMHGTDDHMLELLHKLARYPLAGCFEDALPAQDLPGYIELRQRSPLPVVLHHCPLGATYEVLMGAADVYMLGHARIGDAIRRAGLFAAGNIPFMLQNVGGNITRAMTCQMMAAFPSANFHFFSDCETWSADVVDERPEPTNGFLRVSEGPGLGVTLNRGELERLAGLQLPEQPKWIIKSRFENGTRMYNIADPQESIFMVRPDRRRMIPMSYDAPIETQYWDDDGTPEYRAMFERLEREGMVMEPEPA